MFRTALCSTVALLGLAVATPAQAGVVSVDIHAGHIGSGFEVQFRTCAREPWRVYRVTNNHERAHDLARHLRHDGFQVRVEHCR